VKPFFNFPNVAVGTLTRNLGANPEVRTTRTGNKIVSFSLATSETWTAGHSVSARNGPNGTASRRAPEKWGIR